MFAASSSPRITNYYAPFARDVSSASRPDELGITLVAQPSTQELLVSLIPPTQPHIVGAKDIEGHTPLDLCLVIDVSGSMCNGVLALEEQDESNAAQLSVLDSVKHATRTIIESMDDEDRIGIVTFSDSAEVIAPLTPMNEENRAHVWSEVEALQAGGMANLWDGLNVGVTLITGAGVVPVAPADPSLQQNNQGALPFGSRTAPTAPKLSSFLSSIGLGKKRQAAAPPSDEPKSHISLNAVDARLEGSSQRLPAVFILTGGQLSIEPPRGHILMLKSYLNALPSNSSKLTISTFSFGCNLGSGLLSELADLGRGRYHFVPDPGLFGAAFIHAVANLMVTWATGCILDVEIVMKDPPTQAKVEVLGSRPVRSSSWNASIQVGDLQYGEPRAIVIKLPVYCLGGDANHTVNISARYFLHALATDASLPRITLAPNGGSSVVLPHKVCRLSFVYTIASFSRAPPWSKSITQVLSKAWPFLYLFVIAPALCGAVLAYYQ